MKPLDAAFNKFTIAENAYIEYINDYVTVEKFAEHKDLSVVDAQALINLGKQIHLARTTTKETKMETTDDKFSALVNALRKTLDSFSEGAPVYAPSEESIKKLIDDRLGQMDEYIKDAINADTKKAVREWIMDSEYDMREIMTEYMESSFNLDDFISKRDVLNAFNEFTLSDFFDERDILKEVSLIINRKLGV